MKKQTLLSVISILLLMIAVPACKPDENGSLMQEEPQLPTPDPEPTPAPAAPDTIELKIGTSMSIQQEEFVSRSGNSRDLIGVQIDRKISISPYFSIYASGVFDDIDDIVFKFVKGGSYQIKMTYYPNAKDIVYNYPDGTFGAPFSCNLGLESYSLNEPVYFSGTAGGGDQGPVLWQLMDMYDQTTSSRLVVDMKRGTTPKYSGMTDFITVDEKTNIVVKLELCLMSVTLEPENFTKGRLTLKCKNRDGEWHFKPGDKMTCTFQTGYPAVTEDLQLFYTEPNGDKYLLATKELECKYATNVVFRFSLAERADGSIGIQVPSDDTFADEESTFDY